jgi:RNA polymerase sigma-70 factor (ECF subfamily)
MTDETLEQISLEALRRGDRAEFSRLVETYYNPVYRLALRMTADARDAEDVLQNTFLQALQHVAQFEGRSSLSTWLYRIAANEALMMLRRRKPEVSIDDEPDDEAEAPHPIQIVDWGSVPEDQLLSGEGRKHLDAAIRRLPDNLRIVFSLRDLQDLSIKETAEALNLTETAVKTRLLRARLHLREQLSAYYAERIGMEKST